MEAQKSWVVRIVILLLILGIGLLIAYPSLEEGVLYPSLYEQKCKTRVYADLEAKVSSVESANIRIMREFVDAERDSNFIRYNYTYATTASGVVFAKKNGRYYAFTAFHVVRPENTKHDEEHFIVATTFTPSYEEYRMEGNSSRVDYYNDWAEATVEYTNPACDLAIISFQTSDQLCTVSVAPTKIQKGAKIVSVGNPANDQNEYFLKSYGKVLSSQYELFTAEETSTRVMKHNAYIAPGSSGGAVFDDQMRLVGINIGGGTDELGRFRYGAFVTNEQLQQCLAAWNG